MFFFVGSCLNGQTPNLSNAGNRPGVGTLPANRGPGKRVVTPTTRRQISNSVRVSWHGRYGNQFTNNWFIARPGWNGHHWHYHRGWHRYPATYWWRPATAVLVTGWFANRWRAPAYYNYGETIYYQDNSVYNGDQVVATADEYYQQATTITESVPNDVDAETVEWMPLGVFALTQQDTVDSNMLLQLTVSKDGIIAGTFYNETTDVTHPVEGMVDKDTQRTAWSIADGSNPDVVMETGIYNLTEDETTALVHFGTEQSQEWLMVRLEEPDAKSANN